MPAGPENREVPMEAIRKLRWEQRQLARLDGAILPTMIAGRIVREPRATF